MTQTPPRASMERSQSFMIEPFIFSATIASGFRSILQEEKIV
jgi:hypothetical protein